MICLISHFLGLRKICYESYALEKSRILRNTGAFHVSALKPKFCLIMINLFLCNFDIMCHHYQVQKSLQSLHDDMKILITVEPRF